MRGRSDAGFDDWIPGFAGMKATPCLNDCRNGRRRPHHLLPPHSPPQRPHRPTMKPWGQSITFGVLSGVWAASGAEFSWAGSDAADPVEGILAVRCRCRRRRDALNYPRSRPAAVRLVWGGPIHPVRRAAHSSIPSSGDPGGPRADDRRFELTRAVLAGDAAVPFSSRWVGDVGPPHQPAGTGSARQGRPSRSMAQSRTKSLRARATIAGFLRLTPPRLRRANVARAHGLYRSMHQPHSTNSLRSTDEPRRLIRPLRSVSPDWYCRGVKPA